MTKAAKVEQFDSTQAEMWRNYRAMEAFYSKRVTWSKWVSERGSKESKYRLGVFDTDSPDGGHCITVFAHGTQRPALTVYGWEDFQFRMRNEYGTIFSEVIQQCISDLKAKEPIK